MEDMRGTAGETTFSNELLHMDTPVFADQQKCKFVTSVRTLVAVLTTYRDRWPIGIDGVYIYIFTQSNPDIRELPGPEKWSLISGFCLYIYIYVS